MFNNSKTQIDPRQTLAEVPTEVRLLWANIQALRLNICDHEEQFIFQAKYKESVSADIFSPANARGPMILASRAAGVELAGAKALLATLEKSEDGQKACAIMEPLLKEIEKVESAEAERLHLSRRAEITLTETREAAKTRAVEQIEKDPLVIAAKQAVAKLKV